MSRAVSRQVPLRAAGARQGEGRVAPTADRAVTSANFVPAREDKAEFHFHPEFYFISN